ncbi:sodium:alanine symporter family protein [Carboxylicivirga sp. M1479]|uniref:alanine/glycine:cation symporter family protein n=1 Tax=Carboxylicivirga sp. M1479 TaxID=2594476 RepID=UPI0011777FF1|nr:amino acid carrier protein [Carboxylicivirga sp. M1479]TRX70506.1 sodium:alanine symporter family protein [Carboxylicivirga sp. M1479]
MQALNDFLLLIDSYIGSHTWFVLLLLGTGIFFTFYLRFPQIRFLKYAIRIVQGKFDKDDDVGDTSHFQALTTALSGTVGTGNIAGVAFAVHLGGPAALFWMLVTAMFGMTTKFVEVTLSHKYREKAQDGSIAGGPMYFMRKRLNIKTSTGKTIKTGYWIAGIFALATILSSFGTGSLPQINSIANSLFSTFGVPHMVSGLVLAILLGFVIIGGIKRIAKVTSKLVPAMALIYFIGAMAVILYNYENIWPSIQAVVGDIFTGSSAVGGFLGASIAFAFNRGVNRGLFSNEAGQGSAPIAHAAAKAHEPVSEGLVALLEPFIDTILICTLTGFVLLSSGVWSEKLDNRFQLSDLQVLNTTEVTDQTNDGRIKLGQHISGETALPLFDGQLSIEDGKITSPVTLIHARSLAENVIVKRGSQSFNGTLDVQNGNVVINDEEIGLIQKLKEQFTNSSTNKITIQGKSLIHSAPLTAVAFTKSWFGVWGQYIVSIGLLLFAFSTAISWSYYGDRAVTYLWGSKYVIWYHMVYVIAFFTASFIDTTIIWTLSGITIALMTIPNLFGLLFLHKEMKEDVKSFWKEYKVRFPNEKNVPKR